MIGRTLWDEFFDTLRPVLAILCPTGGAGRQTSSMSMSSTSLPAAEAMNVLCQQYDGVYRFAKLLGRLAEGVIDGTILTPEGASSGLLSINGVIKRKHISMLTS